MSDTLDVLTGFAAKIAAQATPTIVWDPNPLHVYMAGQTGIILKLVPVAPDRVIVLNLVPQGDHPSMPLGQSMLQVRARGLANDPTDVDALLDSVFTVLHGSTGLVFGALTVIQCNRRVRAPLGMDENKRFEAADQYYLDIDYPPTLNRPDGGSW